MTHHMLLTLHSTAGKVRNTGYKPNIRPRQADGFESNG